MIKRKIKLGKIVGHGKAWCSQCCAIVRTVCHLVNRIGGQVKVKEMCEKCHHLLGLTSVKEV